MLTYVKIFKSLNKITNPSIKSNST